MEEINNGGVIDPDRSKAFSLMIAGIRCLQATDSKTFLFLYKKFKEMPLPQNGWRKEIERIIHNPNLCYSVVIFAKKAAGVNWSQGQNPKYLRRKQKSISEMIKQEVA